MGGRPAKPIGMAVGARTKDEIEGRDAAEKALKSGSPPRVPSSLNKNQKKICKSIIKKLEKADILCSLDEWILAKTSVAIDKLLEIDREIEENPILKYDRDVMNSRAKTPQSPVKFRAQLSAMLSMQKYAGIKLYFMLPVMKS